MRGALLRRAPPTHEDRDRKRKTCTLSRRLFATNRVPSLTPSLTSDFDSLNSIKATRNATSDGSTFPLRRKQPCAKTSRGSAYGGPEWRLVLLVRRSSDMAFFIIGNVLTLPPSRKRLAPLGNVDVLPPEVFAEIPLRNPHLERRHSHAAGTSYLANVCPHCNRLTGDFYFTLNLAAHSFRRPSKKLRASQSNNSLSLAQ